MDTQSNFKANFQNIMAQAGYGIINMPAGFSCEMPIYMWAKPIGAVAHYYVLYDLSPSSLPDFSRCKEYIDKIAARICRNHNMRHSIIINILSGVDEENQREIEKMLNAPEEFALAGTYDIYFGVDTARARILRNSSQPPNMDGSFDKIQAALGEGGIDGKMFHVEHSRQAIPVAKYPIFTYLIIAVNVLLFVLMELNGGSTNIETLLNYGAISYHHVFTFGEYYRLLTPVFLHIGGMHLIFNTMSLVLFGMRAERHFGVWKFLVIYIISGIGGNLAMALTSAYAVGAGASGSIYGVIGALFAYTKVRKKNVENFNAGILGIMIFVGILMGFAAGGVPGMPNVANSAHIGGLAVGFLLGMILTKEKSPNL